MSFNRPKIQYGKVNSPSPREGVDGDIQVRQSNLGARLFGKISGKWYHAPLTGTDGNPVTRFGTGLSNYLSIDNDSVDIFKNKVKVAEFGETTTLGDTSTEHVEITSSHFKIKDGSTARVTIDSTGVTVPNILLTGKIKLTSSGDRNVCIGLDNGDAGDDNIAIGSKAGEGLHANSNRNVLIGTNAGLVVGDGANDNICIGNNAGYDITNGDLNICIGTQAGFDITTAQANICIGYKAGLALTATVDTGGGAPPARNTLLGNQAGDTITTGYQNTCVGALADVTGTGAVNQIAIGTTATCPANNSAVIGNADITDVYMSQDSGAKVHLDSIEFNAIGTTGESSNVLAEYAEGLHTWTAVGSTSGSWTPRSGYTQYAYTRVGRAVHISGRLETTGAGSSPNGTVRISIPFASSDLANEAGDSVIPFQFFAHGGTITSNVYGIIEEGNSYMELFYNTDAGSATAVTNSVTDSAWEARFSGTYIV